MPELRQRWGPADSLDLLIDLDLARRRAVAAARDGRWLDASLLVAGCGQVVEDHLHQSETTLDRAALHLLEHGRGSGRVAHRLASARRAAHERALGQATLRRVRDALLELSVRAAAAAGGRAEVGDLADAVDAALGPRATFPAGLGTTSLRLPSCFRSFDQHPDDVVALVDRWMAEGLDPTAPVLVVGVRTSGSYLAPIAVAELRRRGLDPVRLITLRPGERLDPSQRAAVGAARGGSVALIDDPPVSGATLERCIETLRTAGVAPSELLLLLALPDGWELPDALRAHRSVVLEGAAWSVTHALRADRVATAVRSLLGERGWTLVDEPAPVPHPVGPEPDGPVAARRGHRRAAFSVTLDDGTGRRTVRTLLVHGAGIGLFGRHDAEVAARLGRQAPDVLGVVDGLSMTLVAAEAEARRPPDPDQVVAYLARRRDALGLSADRTLAMRGRTATWEVAAMLVGDALGRADLALRTAVVEPLVRSILAVEHPAIVDGRMTADRWLTAPDGRLVKVDCAEGAYSNRDLWSSDLVGDLAAIGDELGAPAEVLHRWEAATGEEVDPARWMLLRLVAAWDRHRHGALDLADYRRRLSEISIEHVRRTVLADLALSPPPGDGPWCALDVDGVLETTSIGGASATGLAGATALRTLLAHGRRVVLATGRSAEEVAIRCAAWRLAGGVAEYGSGLVVGGEVVDLRTERQRAVVERVRRLLDVRPDCEVDPAHRLSVRAWSVGREGGRRPLSAARRAEVLAEAGTEVTFVDGEDQTDVVAAGVTKEAGLSSLLRRCDPAAAEADRPLALAVGDGPADVGMLGLARTAAVPAHGRPAVRAAATVAVAGRYQQGLHDAVAIEVGHAPGGCPSCASDLPPRSEALLRLTSVHEAGPAKVPERLARAGAAARRAQRLSPR